MIRHSDGTLALETLVAFADGALSDVDAARIAAELATDAEAARTVEALRATGALAAAAYDDVLTAAMPDRLIAAASGRGSVIDLEIRNPARPGGAVNDNWRRIGAAIAAGLLLLIVGFAGGRLTGTGDNPDLQPAGIAPTPGIDNPAALGALHTLLSDAPMAGSEVSYDSGSIALEAPLALVDGAICWQFRLTAAASTMRGIACPESAGGWAILTRAERGEMP